MFATVCRGHGFTVAATRIRGPPRPGPGACKMIVSVVDSKNQHNSTNGRKGKKRAIDHDVSEHEAHRHTKKRRNRQVVREGQAPDETEVEASDERSTWSSAEDILDAVIKFLKKCSKRQAKLKTIGLFLNDHGFQSTGILCPLLAQNEHLFGMFKNSFNENVMFLRKKKAYVRKEIFDAADEDDPAYEPIQRNASRSDHSSLALSDYHNPAPVASVPSQRPQQQQQPPIVELRARTPHQQRFVALLERGAPIVVVVGPAGTGKTFLAVRAALRALQNGEVSRILVTRPAVAVDERLGYLPGGMEDKMAPYLAPIADILAGACEPAALAAMMRNRTIEVRRKGALEGLQTEGKRRSAQRRTR